MLIGSGSPIPALPAAESHRRRRLSFLFTEDSESELVVRAFVPLDSSVSVERVVSERHTVDGNLDLFYRVHVDLRLEMTLLADCLRKQYRSTKGTSLTGELQVLDALTVNDLFGGVAELGAGLFFRLFLDHSRFHDYNVATRDRDDIQSALRSALVRPHVVNIDSPELMYPWGFLYDDSAFDPNQRRSFDPNRFWGLKHELQHQHKFASRRLKIQRDRPSILAAICPDVDQGMHKHAEHPFLPVDAQVITSCDALGRALADCSSDVVYFFGHSHQAADPSPTESYLKMSGVRLSVDTMRRIFNAPRFHEDPVIAFLNTCHSAPSRRWDDNSVVGFICESSDHRVCCVATIAELPPTFAAEFARHFGIHFLHKRNRIGTALLRAKQHMLTHWNNPLGLVYSLFG